MSKPTRYFSNRQEKNVSKNLGGKKVANSGATPFRKGDVTLDAILIECKTCTTPKKSFSIKEEWLKKNKEEAFAMNKPFSVLAFNFGDLKNPENYYIIDEATFKYFIQLMSLQ